MALIPAGRQAEVRRHFGDSIKGNAELSFVSIGVGIALGLLLGMIPVPLPGGGTFSLGVAGGPLVMALVLGWLGRTGPIGWGMPVVANLVLRNLGLSVLLARWPSALEAPSLRPWHPSHPDPPRRNPRPADPVRDGSRRRAPAAHSIR